MAREFDLGKKVAGECPKQARSGVVVGGFMIISADTLEEAIEVARQSPGTCSPGSSVEVREIETP